MIEYYQSIKRILYVFSQNPHINPDDKKELSDIINYIIVAPAITGPLTFMMLKYFKTAFPASRLISLFHPIATTVLSASLPIVYFHNQMCLKIDLIFSDCFKRNLLTDKEFKLIEDPEYFDRNSK